MGASASDILAADTWDRALAPTFAAYVPTVSAAVIEGTRRVYRSYWNKVVEHWGDKRIDEPPSPTSSTWSST